MGQASQRGTQAERIAAAPPKATSVNTYAWGQEAWKIGAKFSQVPLKVAPQQGFFDTAFTELLERIGQLELKVFALQQAVVKAQAASEASAPTPPTGTPPKNIDPNFLVDAAALSAPVPPKLLEGL